MSEIELRDGTVVRHFIEESVKTGIRERWEIEYPDGETVRHQSKKQFDAAKSRRLLEEYWEETQDGTAEDA